MQKLGLDIVSAIAEAMQDSLREVGINDVGFIIIFDTGEMTSNMTPKGATDLMRETLENAEIANNKLN